MKLEDDNHHNKYRYRIAAELTTAGAVRFGKHKGQLQLPKRIVPYLREERPNYPLGMGESVISIDPDTGFKTVEYKTVRPAEKVVVWAVPDYARWKGASTKEWVEQWLHQESAERLDSVGAHLQDE